MRKVYGKPAPDMNIHLPTLGGGVSFINAKEVKGIFLTYRRVIVKSAG